MFSGNESRYEKKKHKARKQGKDCGSKSVRIAQIRHLNRPERERASERV